METVGFPVNPKNARTGLHQGSGHDMEVQQRRNSGLSGAKVSKNHPQKGRGTLPSSSRSPGARAQAPRGQARPERRVSVPAPEGSITLYGFHPVREALRSSRREILSLLLTAEAAARLAPEIAAKGLVPQIVPLEDLARRLPQDAVHQGFIAYARPLPTFDIDDLPEQGLVLVLDQVTDPHNVGAIVRTAAAFKVDAIVTTERHSPAMSGVLAKSASGGLEHVPLCTVVNLARALDDIGDLGYLRVGLDSEGPATLEATTLSRPLALVLGAEGKGLRRLTRERCDVLARLDFPGAIRSLNVSNACAIALTLTRMKLEGPSDA
jgi:23S rRNA (guanosine2251-2'-O)-methyltransferase